MIRKAPRRLKVEQLNKVQKILYGGGNYLPPFLMSKNDRTAIK